LESKRTVWFSLSIIIGIIAGLFYGWTVNPRRTAASSAVSLRADYKADYVLMVAEVFQKDQDVGLAISRLALLGNDPPLRIVQTAIIKASELGYEERDMQLLGKLSQALQSGTSTPLPAGTTPPPISTLTVTSETTITVTPGGQ
jgi:hypothetical protein